MLSSCLRTWGLLALEGCCRLRGMLVPRCYCGRWCENMRWASWHALSRDAFESISCMACQQYSVSWNAPSDSWSWEQGVWFSSVVCVLSFQFQPWLSYKQRSWGQEQGSLRPGHEDVFLGFPAFPLKIVSLFAPFFLLLHNLRLQQLVSYHGLTMASFDLLVLILVLVLMVCPSLESSCVLSMPPCCQVLWGWFSLPLCSSVVAISTTTGERKRDSLRVTDVEDSCSWWCSVGANLCHSKEASGAWLKKVLDA